LDDHQLFVRSVFAETQLLSSSSARRSTKVRAISVAQFRECVLGVLEESTASAASFERYDVDGYKRYAFKFEFDDVKALECEL
jgi:hypothetical protein